MKKYLSIALAALLLFGAAACSPGTEGDGEAPSSPTETSLLSEEPTAKEGEGKRIFFLNPNRALDYFMYIEAACVRQAEELGYTVTVVDFGNDFAKANDYVSQAIVEKYDLIMLSGDQSLITGVEEANAAGIPVLNYNSNVGGGDLAGFISSDNYGMGVMAGEYAVELLKEKNGEAKGHCIIVNFPAFADMIERGDGFKSVVEQYPDITWEEVIPKDLTIDETQKFTDNTLTAKPAGQIDVIYGANAQTALGALSAVEAANRTEILLVGIDDEEGQLNALKDEDSNYRATVAQNPIEIGSLCAEGAQQIFAGENLGNVAVPSRLVTKETVEEFIANEESSKKELDKYR